MCRKKKGRVVNIINSRWGQSRNSKRLSQRDAGESGLKRPRLTTDFLPIIIRETSGKVCFSLSSSTGAQGGQLSRDKDLLEE